ncbi:MAG: DUF6491 family protein [Rhodospirillaceae bacterium]
MKRTLLAKIGAAALTATVAFMASSAQAQPSRAREARIPFVQYGGIRDWRTANDQEVFIQDSGRRWYRAELMGPCNGLEFANGVRFLPSDSAGTFDRFSWIVANGERCKVQSVVPIRGEPDVPNYPHPRGRS